MTPEERIAAAGEWHRRHVTDRAELEAQLAAETDKLRTVANLFSASVWKLLPQKIKAYFEEYREDDT